MRLKLERSPYKHLLEDTEFKAWLENLERGSVTTASEYLRRIGHVCRVFDLTPRMLAQMDGKAAGNFLLKIVSHFENQGSAGSNITGYARALKSLWSFNDIEVRKKIKIRGAHDYTKYENERVPTKEELHKILNIADIRAKVAGSLIAFAGFRLEAMGTYVGDDGLKVQDFPDLILKDDQVEFSNIPTIIKARKSISKGGHPYSTFLPDQGCQYLKQYLEWRIRNGEKITPESPMITANKFNPHMVGKHIRTINIGDLIRKAIRNAGFKWRPYVLRRYFDTRMMQAEADGIIIRDWRVFWMGHKGDIEHTYTVNKGLPEDVIDTMREAYAKAAEKYLVSIRKETVDVRDEFRKQLLLVAGLSQEEIEKMDLTNMGDEEFQSLVRQRLLGMMNNNGARQRVIRLNEVEAYISQGWEFVASLPNDGAIVRLPF